MNESVVGRVCERAMEPVQREVVPVWLDYARAAWKGGPLPAPTAAQQAVLSSFAMDGLSVPIEPLTGIARHPKFSQVLDCREAPPRKKHPWQHIPHKYDITYLVLASACGDNASTAAASTPRRNRFYDLGCSLPYSKPGERANDLAGGALGPSIELFQSLYSKRCVDFDDIYAWEATRHDPVTWWRYVPVSVRAKTHFYNVPVNESLGAKDGHSFLQHLAASAHPDDFVVVKVDIEGHNGGPELEVVQAIAACPSLAALVDELFFEYHFWSEEHSSPTKHSYPSGWGRVDREKQGTIDDALRLMRRLRKLGVRAHFWI